MNHVALMGRLTRDPEVRYTLDKKAVGSYTLAVDRPKRRDGKQEADFIRCVVWERAAEFAEKYLRKGVKIAVTGRIQTGSYKDRDGKTVYTTDVVVNSQEFCERLGTEKDPEGPVTEPVKDKDGFVDVPEGYDAELPFA